jgi:hypothetical protein
MVIHRARDAIRAESPLNGPRVFGWGFAGPGAIADDGTHVWVANGGNSTVSELSASTGALVKVLAGARYKFDHPGDIASGSTRSVGIASCPVL